MRNSIFISITLLVLSVAGVSPAAAQPAAPELRAQGDTIQLIVDGEPFLILGGELGNSSASDLSYLDPHWEKFRALHLNTVLAPVYWELIEPEEGHFDFTLVDQLIARARKEDMKLVLLWFGTWKNSMSTYVPAWVKLDGARFERARTSSGQAIDIFSPHDAAIRDADSRAFRALMSHLAATDRRQQTVIMVQVENEVGMLPEARDHSPLAEADWQSPVPAALINSLTSQTAEPGIMDLWATAGGKTKGSWAEIFGTSPHAEEIFTAWYLASYVEYVAAEGLKAYDIPIFVNAALNRPKVEPGQYPSGGPLPHLFSVWQRAAPSLDFLAPDIYFSDFVKRISEYDVSGNALFIPEANRTGRPEVGADAFWAFGQVDALGYSPFSIEDIDEPETHPLGDAYRVLSNISNLILAHQGRGTMRGLRAPVAFDGELDDTKQSFHLGNYQFTATMVDPWTPRAAQDVAAHGAIIIALSEDEFLFAGKGVTLTFDVQGDKTAAAGITLAEEGAFDSKGAWIAGRTLNGDQTHQGRHIRLTPDGFAIQKFSLYTYR